MSIEHEPKLKNRLPPLAFSLEPESCCGVRLSVTQGEGPGTEREAKQGTLTHSTDEETEDRPGVCFEHMADVVIKESCTFFPLLIFVNACF